MLCGCDFGCTVLKGLIRASTGSCIWNFYTAAVAQKLRIFIDDLHGNPRCWSEGDGAIREASANWGHRSRCHARKIRLLVISLAADWVSVGHHSCGCRWPRRAASVCRPAALCWASCPSTTLRLLLSSKGLCLLSLLRPLYRPVSVGLAPLVSWLGASRLGLPWMGTSRLEAVIAPSRWVKRNDTTQKKLCRGRVNDAADRMRRWPSLPHQQRTP